MVNNPSQRNIVILSTEPWGKMLLSKMHYALELVRAGNKVFFVNPPRESNNRNLAKVIEEKEDGNLVIIYTNNIRGSLFFRHKFFFIFKRISKRYVKAIRKLVGTEIHEIWCFNPQIYVDLQSFHADKTILLIYDFYRGDHVFKAAETADAVISISQLILDHYKSVAPPKLLLQHGLGKYFAGLALARLRNGDLQIEKGNRIRVGYMGNLLRVGMNTAVARQIIEGHEDIEFHFWGPSSMEDNNVNTTSEGLPAEIFSFIEFLKQHENVSLHGVKEQESLAAGLFEMDAFLFLYSPKTEINAASNSHKLLEYLSTGKAVISTYVSNYAGTDLLIMCDQDGEEKLPEIFSKVTGNLDIYNAVERQRQRITFALDNTYARQVERIQEFIYR